MPLFEPSARLMTAVEETLRDRGYTLKRIDPGLRRLTEMFVEGRGWKGDYLVLPELLAAYTAYYLPVNAMKVRWILEEMSRYAPGFFDRPRRVLDFGCGPGTATLGLAEHSAVPHEVTAIDRVPEALELARALVGTATPFRFSTSTTMTEGPWDLILAANVYAEMPDDRELLSLFERLDPRGYLVVLEPARKESTRRLMTLRDAIASSGLRIAAPCLSPPRCPMLVHEDLWCHMDVRWTRPAWIQKLDDRIGLDKESLKFSYLAATKEGPGLSGTARVVSDLHREKGKSWAWLCGGGGTLCRGEILKRDVGPDNRAFAHAKRGDVLTIEPFAAGERARFGEPVMIRKAGDEDRGKESKREEDL